ncbi:hypothetical protein KUV46_07565 [Thalassovita mediterranea]|nr:hypothetical protein KUV46_07565 [Thalassovita mediterranea]
MKKTLTSFAALSTGLLLVACSPDNNETDTDASTRIGKAPIVNAQDSDEVTTSDSMLPDDTAEADLGVTGSDATLTSLQPISMQGADMLDGELRCSFQTADSGEPLLIAAADVDPDGRATAAINNDGADLQLYGEQLGGFSGLEEDGGTFAGEGMVIVVELGDATLDGSQTEQTSQAATMTVNRADGATRTFDGEWVCGP